MVRFTKSFYQIFKIRFRFLSYLMKVLMKDLKTVLQGIKIQRVISICTFSMHSKLLDFAGEKCSRYRSACSRTVMPSKYVRQIGRFWQVWSYLFWVSTEDRVDNIFCKWTLLRFHSWHSFNSSFSIFLSLFHLFTLIF